MNAMPRPDWLAIRTQFPVLTRQVHGKPLVYLDSANTSQKPQAVIRAVDAFYREHNANVSRAMHALGSEATEAYEGARRKLAAFVGVPADELVLTSGTMLAWCSIRVSRIVSPSRSRGSAQLYATRLIANVVPDVSTSSSAGTPTNPASLPRAPS